MMENILDEIEEDDASGINENNLLTNIWIKPKATLKYVLEHCPQKYITILFALGGVGRTFDRASGSHLGDKLPIYAIILIAIIFGGLFGWMFYYLFAWLISSTGRWINGNANPEKFRTIIAWSLIPSICSLALLFPQMIIFEDNIFKSETDNSSLTDTILTVGFGVLELILSIWSIVILVKGISIIQGFNTGKAIINLILPIVVFMVLVVLVILLFAL